MGMLSLSHNNRAPAMNWEAPPATDSVRVKQEDEGTNGFVDATLSLPTLPVVTKEEQLLELVKEEKADDFLDESSSLPIDLVAKNGDASLITEEMEKEEEQLQEARLKAEEEEEARKREEAAKLAIDPEARYSKLDEVLTKEETVETQSEETQVEEKKKGRGGKRKAKPQYNDRKAKMAVAAMLTRSHEDRPAEECGL